jgi:hypothetical protein
MKDGEVVTSLQLHSCCKYSRPLEAVPYIVGSM